MNLNIHSFLFLVLAGFVLSSCTASKNVTDAGYGRSSASEKVVVDEIPNYENKLRAISGRGRAIVSEPGNSDRVTIDFKANEEMSLLTVQNRIGIEGGQMLVDSDSILIYNRLDKIAQKVSVYDWRLTSVNELASINVLDLINFKVQEDEVNKVLESNNSYQLRLKNGAKVYVSKADGWVERVEQTQWGVAPYSRIIYEGYGKLEGFILPRKITIFSSDGNSRVVFLVRNLEINPKDLRIEIDIPDNIIIQRR